MILLIVLSATAFAFASTAFAADKPVWTVYYENLNLPNYGFHKRDKKPDPLFNIQFTPDNKILVRFLLYKQQTKSARKAPPEHSVILLLSKENGKLINRVVLPVMPELFPSRRNEIFPLPSGGYVQLIDRHLQVFDSSFNVIYSRVSDGDFSRITVPLSGKFFILHTNQNSEIIDSDTFETVERLEQQPNFAIEDIWGDRLLAVRYIGRIQKTLYSLHEFYEKKIGASQWNYLGFEQGERPTAQYIYNGAIVVDDRIGLPPDGVIDQKRFWFMIEDGKKSDAVFKDCKFTPSWNTPVMACKNNKTSAIRELLDLFGKTWIEAYDLITRQVLLKTKAYTPDSISGEDVVDYAISPNGDSIVLMTSKKIELYTVKPKKDKKK